MIFWKQAIDSLNLIKPMFMLAEAEDPSLHQAGFQMTYTWEYMHITNEIAQGKMTFKDLDNLMAKEDTNFSQDLTGFILLRIMMKTHGKEMCLNAMEKHIFYKQF